MSKFTLFDQEVEFSKAADRYYKMLKVYEAALNGASDAFRSFYDNSGNISDVLDDYAEFIYNFTEKTIVEPLYNSLIKIEIYDVSREKFDNLCWDLSGAEEYYDSVAEQYNSIYRGLEEERSYREMRKEGRGRFIGGGFGIGGATKGILSAGALNAITGAGHSIVNSIGNLKSSISASSNEEKLYECEETFEMLDMGVRACVKDIFILFMSFVNDYKEKEGTDIWYDGSAYDFEKADTLLKNSSSVEGKEKELLFRAFSVCPYYYNLLCKIFLNYEEERKNIYEISKYYKLDLSPLFSLIIRMMYDEDAEQSDEKAYVARDKIKIFMSEYDITENDTLNKLEKDCLRRYCEKYRTLLPGETDEFIDGFNAYDFLKENKIEIIKEYKIWELFAEYGIKVTSSEKETIIFYFIKNHKDLAYDAIIEKIHLIMGELKTSTSKTLDQFEYSVLKSIAEQYSNAPVGKADDIVAAIKECKVSDQIKAKYIHDCEIWELFKEYKVGFNDDERLDILYRIYKKLLAEGAVTQDIQNRLLPVVEAFVSVEESPQTFAKIKVLDVDTKRIASEYAKKELEKINMYGVHTESFSEVNDWGNNKTYQREDCFFVDSDNRFCDLLKEMKNFIKFTNDIDDLDDIFLVVSSGAKDRSCFYTVFTTQNIYSLGQNKDTLKTTVENVKIVLSNGVLSTLDHSVFREIYVSNGWDVMKKQSMVVATNNIINYIKSLAMDKEIACTKIKQYYDHIRLVLRGEISGDERNWFVDNDVSDNKCDNSSQSNDSNDENSGKEIQYFTRTELFNYVKTIASQSNLEHSYYYYAFMPGCDSLLNKAKKYYAKPTEQEIPLILNDNSIAFSSGKRGFLLTNTHIYINNIFQSKVALKLNDIKKIDISQLRNLGDSYAVTLSTDKNTYFITLPLGGNRDSAIGCATFLATLIDKLNTIEIKEDIISYFGMEEKVKKMYEAVESYTNPQGDVETSTEASAENENIDNDSQSQEENHLEEAKVEIKYFTNKELLWFVGQMVKECNMESNYYIPATAENFLGLLDKAKRFYAMPTDAEIPLLINDNSVFSNGKKGFLLTSTHIHICNMFQAKIVLNLKDIKTVGITRLQGLGETYCVYLNTETKQHLVTLPIGSDRNSAFKCAEFMLNLINNLAVIELKEEA